MKFDNKEIPFLFNNTTLPDIFFSDYLPELSSDCVKIYLYIVFLAKYNKIAKLNDLSKKLNIQLKDVNDVLETLEKYGLIYKKPNGYTIQNLQEITLNKLYSPNIKLSNEKIDYIKKDKSKSKMIDHINSTYFNGIMSPTWLSDIDIWHNKYHFDEQVMITLFDYCFSKSKFSRSYISKVAETWHLNKITTWPDLEDYFKKQENFKSIKQKITKKLNKYNGLTTYEEAYIDRWVNQYNYDMDVIEIALKRSTFKQNITFEYLNTLITDWNEHNLKTQTEVISYIESSKAKKDQVKQLKKSTNYKPEILHRQYDDLSMFYANNDDDE